MKKTLLTCMAVLALFAIASSASAITCTIDQRPAATLLVPYFAVSLLPNGTPQRGTLLSFDTLIAIGNASSAPTIAHVSVYNKRSTLVLDFNVALTGFDIQTWRMSDILSGILPSTPIAGDHTGPTVLLDPLGDACQRNPLAPVYPDPNGFLRVRPTGLTNATANPDDNKLATSAYPIPAFDPASGFGQLVVDSLDDTDDSRNCGDGTVDGVTSGPAIGYITIDQANYCTLNNPDNLSYYQANALGAENSLFGDIIFLSDAGIGTYGMAAVAIESDPSFSGALQGNLRTRTFYARYWDPISIPACENCTGTGDDFDLAARAPWDVIVGDQREPLGLRYAARYFEGSGVVSFFDVWRASAGSLADLEDGANCDTVEPTVALAFFDEDENTVTQTGPGPCPSPCSIPPPQNVNFPFETNRVRVNDFVLPSPLPGGPQVGWVAASFVNTTDGTSLDQAFMAYEFDGTAAFISAHFPAFQLDPSNCEPLGYLAGIDFNAVVPTIPGGVDGTGSLGAVPFVTPPAGVGPVFVTGSGAQIKVKK
jgi:hypothetical protein